MSKPNVTTATLLAANESFYDAFDMGDLKAMAALWSEEYPVACIHPGAGPIIGREEVLSSWRDILSAPGRPAIQCLDPTGLVFDSSGLVICTEALARGQLVASNLFMLEQGVWRMVHHQAGPINVPMSPPRPATRLH
tara:strand:+ start:74 stop:484 length:411 start_codon:yes stop_codon:yes gene_type:complete